MNEQSMNAAAFDRWQATYDADVLVCDQAGEYPFAGYCQLMEQLFQLVHRAAVIDYDFGAPLEENISKRCHRLRNLNPFQRLAVLKRCLPD